MSSPQFVTVSSNQDFALRNQPGRAGVGSGVLVPNVARFFSISGEIDYVRVERALRTVVARHEALRTRFINIGGEWIGEVIDVSCSALMEIVDVSHLDADKSRASALEIAVSLADEPFSRYAPPLARVALIKCSEDQHVMVIALDHIVADYGSLEIFVRELSSLYSSSGDERSAGLLKPRQYHDYVEEQNRALERGDLDETLDYWRRSLQDSGAMPSLRLDFDKVHGAEVRGATSRCVVVDFPTLLDKRLSQVSASTSATFFTAVLAATLVALRRYSDTEKLSLLVPVGNRPKGDSTPLIGWMAHSVVFSINIEDGVIASDLIERVRGVAREVLSRQGLSHHFLKRVLTPEQGGKPRSEFGVKFNFLTDLWPLTLGAASVTDLIELLIKQARIPKNELLLVVLRHDNRTRIAAFYEGERFDDEHVENLLNLVVEVLEMIVNSPDQKLSVY